MFLRFFEALRRTGIPVSLREYLSFLEGLVAGLATYDVEGFYYLARVAMVKDERHLDRFDRAFSECFQGLDAISAEQVPVDVLFAPEAILRWRAMYAWMRTVAHSAGRYGWVTLRPWRAMHEVNWVHFCAEALICSRLN